jgi:hypothetical protein
MVDVVEEKSKRRRSTEAALRGDLLAEVEEDTRDNAH